MNEIALYQRYIHFVTCTSVISILVGIGVLIGYAFNIVALKSIMPFWLPMKANTAVCFILSGIVVWKLRKESEITRQARLIASICAFIILLFSVLTFAEYLWNFNLGVDQLLFHDKIEIDEIIYPGRTSVATTVSLFLLSLSFFLIDSRFSPWLFQISVCIVISIAFMG